MQLSSIGGVLWAASYAGQLALFVVLLRTRHWRPFAFFTAYMAYNLLADPAGYWVLHHASARAYFTEYLIAQLLDFTLQLLVLLEIGLNVLRPVKRSLPKQSLLILTGVCVVTIPLALWLAPQAAHNSGHLAPLLLRVGFGFAIARLLIFAAIAGFAQVLGINWRNHVLQLTTGLAFYSAISILVEFSLNHMQGFATVAAKDAQASALMELQSAAYIATLVFWLWAFSRNEAPRKEFTPQMEAVLVTIAGTANRTRLAVTRSLGQR